MNIHIRKLINNNKWDEIYKLIKKSKIDLSQEIINGNNIIHLASTNNKKKIIKYILDNDYELLKKSNGDGISPIHLMANYGYDILLECIKKYPEYMDLIDNNGNTILYTVNREKNDMFNKLLDIYVNNTNKVSNILDVINDNNETLLTYCINNTLINNDLYFNICV